MEEVTGTMQALVANSYGDLSQILNLESLAVPKPGPQEVVIKVHFTSVNPVNWKIMKTDTPIAPKLPHVPLHDFSGVVTAVGPGGTKNLTEGQAVYGYLSARAQGVLSEYALIHENYVYPKPEGLSFEEAAALPLVSCTAIQGIFTEGKVTKDDKVFVAGGSTATGLIAIQILKSLGCEVASTCSERTRDLLEKLGVDKLVDYKTEKWEEVLKGQNFTVVFDTVGEVWEPAQQILKKSAQSRVLSITVPSSEEISIPKIGFDLVSRKFWNFVSEEPNFILYLVNPDDPSNMLKLTQLVNDGVLKHIVINEVFEFQKAGDAIAKQQAGVVGKVLVKVGA